MSTGQPWLVRAALASARVPNLLAHGSSALLNGLWLGVLSDTSLQALDEAYYRRTSIYQTVGWNERGLFGWESRLVEEHFQGCERIAVPACGGGREVLALLESGRDAVGYESHPELAAFAGEFLSARGHPSRVRRSNRDEFPTDDACDGAVVGWGAYSLIHGQARRARFLDGAVRALPAGAPLLLSFFDRDGDHRDLRWVRTIAGVLRRLRGAAPVELGDTLSPNLVHVFRREEVEHELTTAGFEVVSYGVVGQADERVRYAAAVARRR
jgi:hypothetical protein